MRVILYWNAVKCLKLHEELNDMHAMLPPAKCWDTPNATRSSESLHVA